MKIQYAIDWQEVQKSIKNDLNSIGYNPDLKRMYDNIGVMVSELSKLEVTARRTHRYSIHHIEVIKINNAIDYLEKLILMAKLMA
jgi:uncharacterized protein YutE (UPF0331/DUF86 family)